MLLCSFGIFDSAIHIFDDHSQSMFNIQQYSIIDLCITLILTHKKKFQKIGSKNTDVIISAQFSSFNKKFKLSKTIVC